jgi:alpha-galactosidase
MEIPLTDSPVSISTDDISRSASNATRTGWRIATDALTVEVGWDPAVGLHLVGLASADGQTWAGDPRTPIFITTWSVAEAVEDTSSREQLGADTSSDSIWTSLAVRLMERGQTVIFNLRVHATLPIAEAWLEVTATTAATLKSTVPLQLAVITESAPTLSIVDGIQGQGGGHPAGATYQTFKLENQPLSGQVRGESGPRSTWSGSPWFAISDQSRDAGIVGGLLYSGSWERWARYDETSGVTTISVAPTHQAPTLVAGQTWTSPTAFVGLYQGDLDEAAAVQHAYQRDVLSPPLPADFPWVQYNTWYSYVCDLRQDTLLEEARIAAELGTEIFYLDAGWWVTSPSVTQDRFTTGLGVWRESRAKFPDGLVAFSDRIRDLGMRFGIWVEPERVDLRRLDLATWRTEWLARHDGTYVRADWPGDTDSAWLCFGDQAAQDWAFGWIGELVESTDAKWLKWDSNYWGICTHPDHGHDPGDGEAAQVAGVHRVMDRLIERFPDLVIENCAGGGTRMDFAMAQHSHAVWVSDATSPSHRVRFQNTGAAYLYSPATLNSWLIDSVFEHTGEYDQSEDVLRAMIRSRMLGAFGLSCRLIEWTDETRRIAAEEIAVFKGYRGQLRDGFFAHLTPQPPIDPTRMATPGVWDVYQTLSADGRNGQILAFRNASADETLTVFPKRIDPTATYRIDHEHGDAYDRQGDVLLSDGITIRIRPLISERVTLSRIG